MSDDVRAASVGGMPAGLHTDSLTTLVPGVRIGKYEIVGVLGAGAFGITYRARDTLLGREVALKEYLPVQFAARQRDLTVLPRSTKLAETFLWGRERFLAEARTLAQLTDAPGVVDVFEYLEANGTAYMVMALVRGETLEARLERDGRLGPDAIAYLLPPLLDGLERVHRAGFLHRDIKPGNILIDGEGQPTLIDFGASRAALLDRTQAMTAVYTPGYAAFEQITSSKQGPWTDIYGLAATLYHCVAGRAPQNVLERLGEDRLVPAAQIAAGRYDPALLAMIDAGLVVRPESRPQSIVQWRGARPDAAIGQMRPLEGSATRVVLGSRGARPPHRRWWVWAAAAAVFLLVGGGSYFALVDRGPTAAERQAAEAQAQADAKRRAEEAAARRAAEEQARAAAARQAAEEKARADAEAKRQADEAARRATEEKTRAEDAARRQAEEDRARADAEAKRQAEETARRAAAEKAQADAEARRQAEEAARARAEAAARERAEADARVRSEADARRQAEAAEVALRLTEPDRRRVQIALTSLGHDTAGSDGAFGPRTRQMIAAWQKKQSEPETGFLTAAQWALLQQQAAAALAKHDEDLKRREKETPPTTTTATSPATGGGNRDCPQCPEMVRLRPGAYLMGSTPADPEHEADEAPQHRVAIGYAFALGKYEVTRGEFAAFADATGHRAAGDWRSPGFNQTDRDPVVNVSWDDAQAYVAWLGRTTGKTYRLPNEAEWEYAARAGTTTSRYWGDGRQESCRFANADDAAFGCSDGFKNTAPVGRFQPNAFGLYDMLGNVWEWTADCWNADHNGASPNGQARLSGDCSRRTVRGGSWGSSSGDVRSSGRTRGPPGPRNFVGFRVARGD